MPDVIKEKLDRLTNTSSAKEVTDEANREDITERDTNHEEMTDEANREDITERDTNRDEIRRSHRLKLKAQRIMRRKGAEALGMSNISVSKAIKYDPKRAAEAIHKELEQMLKGKKVFSPVKRRDVPNGCVVRSYMFLKYKYDAQGKLERLKGRLVADGRAEDRDQ